MPLNPKEIGQRIKELRNSLKLNQKVFGEGTGLTQGGVSLYEKGKRIPDPGILVDIAEFCNVTVDWILTGKAKGKDEKRDRDAERVMKDYIELSDKHKSLVRESIASYLKAQKK